MVTAVTSHRMPRAQCLCIMLKINTLKHQDQKLLIRGGSHNAPTRIHLKPTQLVGGYAQISYHFYYGPIGNQRDVYVAVRKMKEVNWLED